MGGHGQVAWSLSFARRLLAPFTLAALAATALRAEPLDLKAAPRFDSAALALDPVNFVMAQADLGTAARRALGDEPAPAVPAAKSSLMRLFFQDSAEGARLQLPPLRWRGNAGFELRMSRDADSLKRRQVMEHVSAEVGTYIGQPWLAQVRANLGFVTEQQRITGDSTLTGNYGADRSVAANGGMNLAIFPTSRFPFTASFESSDSRTSGEATPTDYVTRALALRQSYRSPLGDQIYGGSLERNTLISQGFGRDTVTSLSAAMQRRFELHTLDVNGSYAQNRRVGGEGSDVSRLFGRHSYLPSDLATVDTYASLSMQDIDLAGFGLRSRFFQVNSFGTWRPAEESPLFVTGGARLADSAFGENSSRTAGVNLAMTYALRSDLNVVASASVTNISVQSASDWISNQAVGATYSPRPLSFAGFDYSWNAGASVVNQLGGPEGAQHAIGVSATHQLARNVQMGGAVSLHASIGQSGGFIEETVRDPTTTLQHSGSIALRLTPNPASNLFIGLNAGDARSQGGREDRFRLLNLQLSGQLQLGVYSVVSANYTLQAVRQHLGEASQGAGTRQHSGSFDYRHTRLFGVRRLRLVLNATFNDMLLESRLLGDAAAPRDQFSRLYEQRLEYDIGRLEFRLGTRFATYEGKSDRQLFFRVNRQFGLY